jgi:DNA polymerase
MSILSIDIETFSDVPIECGVHAYCNSQNFDILLVAYALDTAPVQIVDLTTEKLPKELISALTDENYIKCAFNVVFEFNCLSRYLNLELDIMQWSDTMVQALEYGLPQSLEKCAEVLGLEHQKDKRGKALIKKFSVPDKNGNRVYPESDLLGIDGDWETFKEYCKQDVEVERAIRKTIPLILRSEFNLWCIDQNINNRGVRLDVNFCKNALSIYEKYSNDCLERMKSLTKLENPKSPKQVIAWLSTKGIQTDKLDKSTVQDLLKTDIPEDVKEVLQLRREISKTSIAKYPTMLESRSQNDRLRGILQFYGTRTGRWAGRIIQPQNLPQNHISDLDFARSLVSNNDYDSFYMCYDVAQTLSELIRTALIPSENCRFIVSDFSAIEARVIAWVSGEHWRLDVFNNNGDIYCASASQMFHVPVEKHGQNAHLRQKGKIAELALGYGGSVGALISMGALKMGIAEEELQPLVDQWRESNPHITKLWKDVENATINVIKGGRVETINGLITIYRDLDNLYIRLPNERRLTYRKPKIVTTRFGKSAIGYMGVNQTTKKWEVVETFGGKLVENIIQAIARDCLAENIIKLDKLGFKIVFHVHDEVIIDCPVGVSSAEEISQIMGEPIPWAKGLPLKAEAYECDYYQKD